MGCVRIADQHAELFVNTQEGARFAIHMRVFANPGCQAAPAAVQSAWAVIRPTVDPN